MIRLANILFFIILLFLIATSPAVAQSSLKSQKKPNPDPPIEVSADHVEQNTSENVIRARGRVIVRYKGKMVRADRLKINMKTGQGLAEGR